MTEIDRVKNGYWWYSAAGLPIPGFVLEILPDQTYRDRFTAWLARFDGCQAIAAFYIESKYRAAGCVATMADLCAWCRRAEEASPELSASAKVIQRDYFAAQEAIMWEQLAKQKKLAEHLADRSDQTRMKRELDAKNLPAGKEANLALIRATVGQANPATLLKLRILANVTAHSGLS
jgi:hypothetical protein